MIDVTDVSSNWFSFIELAQDEIFPIYSKHELSFDRVGIHGRMHISRAIIFAEALARCYLSKGTSIDISAIRYATAFHDSGRKGNGMDIWESESAARCEEYLKPKFDNEHRNYIANIIRKDNNNWDINKRIMHDADVLEIMRPCAGHGGLAGFQRKYLHFANQTDPFYALFADPLELRELLIHEAWSFILKTEEMKILLQDSNHYLLDVLSILEQSPGEFRFLNRLINDTIE